MDFYDAAHYFDQDRILDGYSGAFLFLGHTSAHDDHTSSGATSRRRTLTTVPGTVPPPRGVVEVFQEKWLLGSTNPDSFDGIDIRRNYDMKKTTGMLTLLTPAQACLAEPGHDFYAHKEFYRDTQNPMTDAEFDVMWNIFCPLSDNVQRGQFFRSEGRILRVRNAYDTAELLRIAETDEFDEDALQSAHFIETGAIDLGSDLPGVLDVTTTVIQTDVPKYYQFHAEAEPGQKPGDRTVFVAKSVLTPDVGTVFTMLGVRWRTLIVVDEQDSWALRARLA